MKRTFTYILSGLLLLMPLENWAQIAPIMHYESFLPTINPALIGLHQSRPWVAVGYRNQTLAPGVESTQKSFMGVYALHKKDNTTPWGTLAAQLFSDQIGDYKSFQHNGAALTMATNWPITAHQWLSFGIRTSWVSQQFSTLQLSTESQWVANYGYNATLANGETSLSESANYLSIQPGVAWRLYNLQGQNTATLGLSLSNVNRPINRIGGQEAVIARQWNAFAAMRLLERGPWSFSPEVLWQQQQTVFRLNGGLRSTFHFTNENPFDLVKSGALHIISRYTSARSLQGVLQLEQPSFVLGAAWEWSLPSQKAVPGYAFELLLSFRIPEKKNRIPAKDTQTISDYSVGQIRQFYANPPTPTRESPTSEKTTSEVQSSDSVLANAPAIQFQLKRDFKFGFNDIDLSPEAKLYLDELAALLKANESLRMEIIGHTDDQGTASANRKVSYQRANKVIDYLISVGIEPKRLKATAKSDEEPLYPNDTEANRARNRRVEFIIHQ
ncbi:OmpA family protein [Cytophagales bacterium LB-30]|uniref:OmpA family protein n=1 Tax=Shiella aurantiaca TaxID=3058365 RepID=A0ABT8F0C1_9BACT|nr:OmpA family protein [Shiella aurantiaca]MDN4163877.1 OmpA family protein [Shiella aurantiaca]